MLAVIEYGMGNLKSISNAFRLLDTEVSITNDPNIIKKSDAIILPGVGAFSDGINNLKKNGLIDILKAEVIDKKKPYLGICLGLEFLADKSYEGGMYGGFGWINGDIKRIEPDDSSLKVPHMGWNDTEIIKNSDLLIELENPSSFYYVHSYYFQIKEKNVITSVCNYGNVCIPATIQKNNIFAVQFHPEKSQPTGIKLLKNFLDYLKK